MIELKPFNEQDLKIIWAIGFKEDYPEWSKWNSPYFDEYRSYQTFEEFKQSKVFDYLMSDTCRGIYLDNKPIGMVSRYWENKNDPLVRDWDYHLSIECMVKRDWLHGINSVGYPNIYRFS
ncbi:hypothetical protein [Globicatella sp. PHS-GS-PNBC-21-1553]|uniref:hypothetical protein n=1 Tax=Globicatella sp. PHS-GS-PNBC-21-1553 TaxID=2885764 RepID=UPI00298F3AED|nr:hypothetical protein [Globicatella sp. PHS-GS-PNBC-21-1553]